MLWLTDGDGFTTTDWSLARGWKISLKIRENKKRRQGVEASPTDDDAVQVKAVISASLRPNCIQDGLQCALCGLRYQSDNVQFTSCEARWQRGEQRGREKQVVEMLTRPQFLAQTERFIPAERRPRGQPGSGNWILAKVWDAMDPKMRLRKSRPVALLVANLTGEKVLVIINISCLHLWDVDALQPHSPSQQGA